MRVPGRWRPAALLPVLLAACAPAPVGTVYTSLGPARTDLSASQTNPDRAPTGIAMPARSGESGPLRFNPAEGRGCQIMATGQRLALHLSVAPGLPAIAVHTFGMGAVFSAGRPYTLTATRGGETRQIDAVANSNWHVDSRSRSQSEDLAVMAWLLGGARLEVPNNMRLMALNIEPSGEEAMRFRSCLQTAGVRLPDLAAPMLSTRGPVSPPPAAPARPAAAPVAPSPGPPVAAVARWELERRGETCFMRAGSSRRRLTITGTPGSLRLEWADADRTAARTASTEPPRIRFAGARGAWTVEATAPDAQTLVFNAGRDAFSVSRFIDLLTGGSLTAPGIEGARFDVLPAGPLAGDFLLCIRSLAPDHETPAAQPVAPPRST